MPTKLQGQISYAIYGIAFVIVLVITVTAAMIPGKEAGSSKKQEPVFLSPLPNVGNKTISPYAYMSAYLTGEFNRMAESEGGSQSLNLQYSTGSFDSLIALENHTKSFAIVQADVLYHYLHGRHPQFPTGKSNSRIRAVRPLFPEYLFISSYNKSEADSKGHFVLQNDSANAGLEGSGSLVTAINVGQILHTHWQWNLHADTDQETLKQTKRPALKLRVRSAEPELAKGWRREWLPQAAVDVLKNSLPGVYASVRSDQFLGPRHPGSDPDTGTGRNDPNDLGGYTISIHAVLVCTEDVTPSEIENMIAVLDQLDGAIEDYSSNSAPTKITFPETISDSDDEYQWLIDKVRVGHIAQHTSYLRMLKDGSEGNDSDAEPGRLPIARHIHLRLKEKTYTFDPIAEVLVLVFNRSPVHGLAAIGLSILLMMLIFLWVVMPAIDRLASLCRNHAWARFVEQVLIFISIRRRYFILFLLFTIAHVVVGTAIWLSELFGSSAKPETAFAASGVIKGTLQVVEMMALNKIPEFRSNLSTFWLVGLKMGYAMTGLTITLVMGNWVWKWVGSLRMENHIIILGWRDGARDLIRDLKEQQKQWVVAVTCKPDRARNDLQGVPGTGADSVQESGDIEQLMKSTRIQKASSVVILSDEKASEAADGRSSNVDLWVLRMLVAVNDLRRKLELDDHLNLVAEIRKQVNADQAEKIGGAIVICQEKFATGALAHSATKPEIKGIMDELLKTTDTSCEIYLEPFPENYTGVTPVLYQQLCNWWHHNFAGTSILLGVMHNNKRRLLPDDADMLVNPDTDQLIIMRRQVSPH